MLEEIRDALMSGVSDRSLVLDEHNSISTNIATLLKYVNDNTITVQNVSFNLHEDHLTISGKFNVLWSTNIIPGMNINITDLVIGANSPEGSLPICFNGTISLSGETLPVSIEFDEPSGMGACHDSR